MDLRTAISGPDFDPLTEERDAELRAVLAGDPTPAEERAVRDELIRRHLRLVLHIGKGYRHRLSDEDILSVGSLALTQAVHRWDPEKGQLYAWAKRWITTALTKAVDASRTIRVPEAVANQAALTARDVQAAEMERGGTLTGAERREIEGDRWTFDRMPSAGVSLDTPTTVDGDEALDLVDLIADPMPGPEEQAVTGAVSDAVHAALAELEPVERAVILARFGFDGRRRTLTELGAEYGVTAEGMRRVEMTAIAKLRHPALGTALGDLL